MQLTGNTIFITGGGSGIGKGLAEAFHQLGNKVIIGGRRPAVLEQTAAANPGIEHILFDVTRRDSIAQGAAGLIHRFPKLNVIINNAGVQRGVDFASDVDESKFEQEIETNIYGVLRVTSAFLPHLKSLPAATIINISSGLAFVPLARSPVYCATKAFIHSFSMSLRWQLRDTGVRVIEVAPPWVQTELGSTDTPGPTAPTNRPGPIPLDRFIQKTLEALRTDDEELRIGRAQFLYAAGINENSDEAFRRMNP